jgi:hypothetical protein
LPRPGEPRTVLDVGAEEVHTRPGVLDEVQRLVDLIVEIEIVGLSQLVVEVGLAV